MRMSCKLSSLCLKYSSNRNGINILKEINFIEIKWSTRSSNLECQLTWQVISSQALFTHRVLESRYSWQTLVSSSYRPLKLQLGKLEIFS